MKAVQFARHGVPHEVCDCVELDDVGAPEADEVVVEIEAAPINPADLLIIEGRYPGPETLPAGLGIEGVGRVTAADEPVDLVAWPEARRCRAACASTWAWSTPRRAAGRRWSRQTLSDCSTLRLPSCLRGAPCWPTSSSAASSWGTTRPSGRSR